MPNGQDTTQIQGLPPGAILKPIQPQADTSTIEGLPPGAVLKPISQAAQTSASQPAAARPGAFQTRAGSPVFNANDDRVMFRASDGGMHSVPSQHFAKARSIDPGLQWVPNANDPLVHIQTGDGQHHALHKDDLEEAKQRDPDLKVFGDIKEDDLTRWNRQMTAAVSDQTTMLSDKEKQDAEKGKKAGFMSAGALAASMAAGPAVGGLFAPGVQAAEEASSILGPEGRPIIKEVLKETPSAAGKVARGVVNAAKGTLDWVNKNPFKAYLLYKLAEEIGFTPSKYHKLIGVVSESE